MRRKKPTKKRLNEAAKRLKAKAESAESIAQLLSVHRALNRMTFIMNHHHNQNFVPENFRPVPLGTVLKINRAWKKQREIRRALIVGHRTFFCPVTDQCLDLDRTFILRGEIFDLSALDRLKPEGLKQVSLKHYENAWG